MEEGVLIELAGTEEKKINGVYRENEEEEEDSDSTPQIEGRGVGGEDEKKDGSKDVESRLSLTGTLLVTASHLQAYPDLLFFGKAQIA